MAKKTIGGFIATLRKANGMTQRELAERLNVSDKTISRWERDDGAPDLALIPVIAEVFGVTCDELLRGERRPMGQRAGEGMNGIGAESFRTVNGVVGNDTDADMKNVSCPSDETLSPKGKKQRQRLLAVSLSKYKNRTFIAVGISAVGLIAAMIGNLGFLRCSIGFFAGAVFYLAAIVCQAVFVNSAFLAVEDGELEADEVGHYKRSVIWFAELSLGLTLVLFAACLPLVTFGLDTYSGLSAGTWLEYGLVYAVIVFLMEIIICFFFNAYLLKKGAYSIGEKAEEIYYHNRQKKLHYAGLTLAGMFLTYVLHFAVTCGFNPHEMATGTQFHDYESFVEFMEQPVPRNNYSGNGPVTTIEVESVVGATIYYDQYGNVISEEEALREEMRDTNGNVVCEYIKRNENVCSKSWTSDADGNLLPITVVTYDDLYIARRKLDLINAGFAVIYCAELLTGIWFYINKRAK